MNILILTNNDSGLYKFRLELVKRQDVYIVKRNLTGEEPIPLKISGYIENTGCCYKKSLPIWC